MLTNDRIEERFGLLYKNATELGITPAQIHALRAVEQDLRAGRITQDKLDMHLWSDDLECGCIGYHANRRYEADFLQSTHGECRPAYDLFYAFPYHTRITPVMAAEAIRNFLSGKLSWSHVDSPIEMS
jgi:hypothetical protein